jgi:hypothetical protein
MPTSIDPQPGENEVECANCGAHFYMELTHCPNCGVSVFGEDDFWEEQGEMAFARNEDSGISKVLSFLRRLLRGG